jgi:UDP-N-acetylglucosamine 2-epimerase
MPEEINRIVTDSITDYFLQHQNLHLKIYWNGIDSSNVHFVGNV